TSQSRLTLTFVSGPLMRVCGWAHSAQFDDGLSASGGIVMHRPGTRPRRTISLLFEQSLIIAIIVVSLGGATAQVPGRVITFVVPYSPGTGPDVLARIVGEEIQQRWSQPVVIENKPGASGNLGTQSVARAAPDGHTLLMVSNPFTANISLFKNVPYDPV